MIKPHLVWHDGAWLCFFIGPHRWCRLVEGRGPTPGIAFNRLMFNLWSPYRRSTCEGEL